MTKKSLLQHVRKKGRPIIISTGMSTLDEVDSAIDILGKKDLVVLQTCSSYPAKYDELNLRVISMYMERYKIPIGYSGHETGLASTVGAVAIGACVVERHLTLDRANWGTDQAASLEPNGFIRLIRDIRLVELAMGSDEKRVSPRELPIKEKLRGDG